jgi:hypothetical protein
MLSNAGVHVQQLILSMRTAVLLGYRSTKATFSLSAIYPGSNCCVRQQHECCNACALCSGRTMSLVTKVSTAPAALPVMHLQHSITRERVAKGLSTWSLEAQHIFSLSYNEPRLRGCVVYDDNTVQDLRGERWSTTSCSRLQWSCVATCRKQ